MSMSLATIRRFAAISVGGAVAIACTPLALLRAQEEPRRIEYSIDDIVQMLIAQMSHSRVLARAKEGCRSFTFPMSDSAQAAVTAVGGDEVLISALSAVRECEKPKPAERTPINAAGTKEPPGVTYAPFTTLSGLKTRVASLSLSRDGGTIVGTDSGQLLAWDTRSGNRKSAVRIDTGYNWKGITFGDDHLTADGRLLVARVYGRVALIELETMINTPLSPMGYVSSVVLTSDGKTIVVDKYDEGIALVDVATRTVRLSIDAPRGGVLHRTRSVSTVIANDDASFVASEHFGEEGIRVWDGRRGDQVSRIDRYLGYGGKQFTPNGREIVAYGAIYSAATGKQQRTLSFAPEAITPDGLSGIVLSGGKLELRSIATGKVLSSTPLFPSTEKVTRHSLVLTPDRNVVVAILTSGSSDIRVWRVALPPLR